MSIELNQQLQPAMQVKVTPKQIAANYILQMSSMALQEAISQELDENPALEMLETSSCPICGAPVTGNYCTECMPRKESANDESIAAVDELPADAAPRLRDEADEFDPIARAEAEFTLDEHLTWNLHAILPRDLHEVADHVIGALDENGFLTETDAEVAAATGHSVEEVAQVRAAMRGIEPIGIGSRSIVESLLAQLAWLREGGEVTCRISPRRSCGEHLAELGERKFRRGGARARRGPAERHRDVGVREGEPQPVPDRGLHRRGQRPRTAHPHPAGRPDPRHRRRARGRGRGVAALQPAGDADLLVAVEPAARQRGDGAGQAACPRVRRAGEVLHRQHQPPARHASSASPSASPSGSATTCSMAFSTSCRSRVPKSATSSGCTSRP